MNITITSAVKLSATQFKKLSEALVAKYGKKYTVVQEVDASVLGGVKVRIGSEQIDATVANTLKQLKTQLG